MLALGGSGSTSYRAIKFNVSGSSTITVVGMSSGTATRTLNISNGSSVIGTLSMTSSLASQSFNYTGGAGTLYIYSAGSGINLYSVSVADSNSGSSMAEFAIDLGDNGSSSTADAVAEEEESVEETGAVETELNGFVVIEAEAAVEEFVEDSIELDAETEELTDDFSLVSIQLEEEAIELE